MKLGFLQVGLLALSMISFGCSGDEEEEFEFGRADMEQAIFGTWTGTWTPTNGTAVPLTLDIRAHDDVARNTACASRSFSGESATPGVELQCGPHSDLSVSATVVVDDGASPTDLDGNFSVGGTVFTGGELSLYGRTSDTHGMWARQEDGAWTRCQLTNGPENFGDCTLDSRVEE